MTSSTDHTIYIKCAEYSRIYYHQHDLHGVTEDQFDETTGIQFDDDEGSYDLRFRVVDAKKFQLAALKHGIQFYSI